MSADTSIADQCFDGRNEVSDEKQGENTTKLSWLHRREKLVRQALDDGDRAALQRIAALPGGFGTQELRKEAW